MIYEPSAEHKTVDRKQKWAHNFSLPVASGNVRTQWAGGEGT